MNSILSSFSILLGVYTFIASVVHKGTDEVLGYTIASNPSDNSTKKIKAKKALKFQQIPLVIGSSMVTIMMLPESIKVLKTTLKILFSQDVTGYYDINSAAILLINILFIIMIILEVSRTKKLFKKIKKLS